MRLLRLNFHNGAVPVPVPGFRADRQTTFEVDKRGVLMDCTRLQWQGRIAILQAHP